MIPEPTREAIRADLRAGLSQRAAASKHNVSLGTITTLAKTLDGPKLVRAATPVPAAKPPAKVKPPPAAKPAPVAAPPPPPVVAWTPSLARIKQVDADITGADALYKECCEKNQMPAAVAAFKSVTALRKELARLEAEAEASKIADPILQTEARVSIMLADGAHASATALAGQLTKLREKDAASRAEALRKAQDGMGDAEFLTKLEEECLDSPDEHLIIAVRAYCARHKLALPTLRIAGGAR